MAWRDALYAGVIDGPRNYASGKIEEHGRKGQKSRGWPVETFADGPEEVRKATQENIDKGIDMVKVLLPRLNEEELAVVVETANANVLHVSAHSCG